MTIPTPAGAPETVKIGHFQVRVRFYDAAEAVKSEQIGYWEKDRMEIGVCGVLQPQRIWEVFWHEVSHALLTFFTLADRKLTEEQFCDTAAVGLAMVMTDNPALHAWMGRLLFDRQLQLDWKPDPYFQDKPPI